jgi:DNA-binding NtrC family response regulator
MIPGGPKLGHVLIVDDEPRLRDMLMRAVSELGFTASAARSAEQAAKMVDEESPAIMLLDLNLPGKSGLDFLKEIHARSPHIQTIILTGYGTVDAAKTAMRSDVADFLTKPCPLDELERALSRAHQRALNAQHAAPLAPPPAGEDEEAPAITASSSPDTRTLEAVEREHILAMLERHHGNRAATASALGISERTLYYRLARYEHESGSGENA